VQFRDLSVLTEPAYAERVSPVQWSGPRRVREPGLAFDARPRVDTVLVSHSHSDHLDLEAVLSIGAHYGFFQLTDEGIGEPLRELEVARQCHGVAPHDFRALEAGATQRLGT